MVEIRARRACRDHQDGSITLQLRRGANRIAMCEDERSGWGQPLCVPSDSADTEP